MQSRNITLFIVQCSKHLTAILKPFSIRSHRVRRFLTNPRKPFTLSSLNCEGYQKIDFHQELVFVERKYLMDIKTVELCSYALQRKKRKLEFMSRKRKSYLGKVVENSSLLCAVAADVGRQFGEFFNRSLLLLRFNLNLASFDKSITICITWVNIYIFSNS